MAIRIQAGTRMQAKGLKVCICERRGSLVKLTMPLGNVRGVRRRLGFEKS